MDRDPLMPEGSTEVEISPSFNESNDPLDPNNSAPSLDPQAPARPKKEYLPELIQTPEYAQDATFIKNRLYSEGDEGFDTAVRLDRGQLQWALEAYKDVSPETAARVQRIASERKIPFETIKDNQDEWLKWKEASDIYNGLIESKPDGTPKYPGLVKWLQSPQKMALAKDDLDALKKIDGLILAHNRPWYAITGVKLKEGVKDLLRGGVGSLQAMSDLASSYDETQAEMDLAIDPLAKTAYIQNAFKKVAGPDALDKSFAALRQSDILQPVQMPEIDGLEGYLYDFAQTLPQFAGTVGASILGGPQAGAAFIGSYIFGDTYGGLREQGATPERAAVAAAFNASVQSALEYIPLASLSKAFKATNTREALIGFFETGLKEFGTEFLQSFPDEAAQIWGMAEKEGQDFNQQVAIFVDRLPEITKQGAYEGLLVAPLALLGASAKLPYDIARGKRLDLDLKFWDGLNQVAGESKLRERSPEVFENYVKDSTENAKGNDKIYIGLQPAIEFFQNDQNKFKTFTDSLGITDQLKEVEASGRDFEISRSKFAALYAGTDISTGLRNHIRFDVEGMTADEQAKFKTELQSKVEEMQNEYKAQLESDKLPPEIVAIREKFIAPKDQGGFGLKAEDADAKLAVFLAGARRLTEQTGESLPDWAKRVNPLLQVGGEGVTAEGALNQTPQLAPEFYSKLEKTIEEKLPNAASPQQVLATLKDIKAEEMQYSGLSGFLEGKTKVSKQELLDFVKGNQIQIKEVTKGSDAAGSRVYGVFDEDGVMVAQFKNERNAQQELETYVDKELYSIQEMEYDGESTLDDAQAGDGETKFSGYKLPGGENYREVLFTLPPKSKVEIDPLAGWQKKEIEQGFKNPETNKFERKVTEVYKREDFGGNKINAIIKLNFITGKYELTANGTNFAHNMKYDSFESAAKDLVNRQANIQTGNTEGNFKSSHWDEPNVLAHTRLQDYTDAEGKKVLLVDEIQSDWHQAGRDKGYGVKEVPTGRWLVLDGDGDVFGSFLNKAEAESILSIRKKESGFSLKEETTKGDGVPDAPFKKTWHEFVIKKVLRMAAEQGYDRVAWTTGDQQAERYDLSKQISKVRYRKRVNSYDEKDVVYGIQAFDLSGREILDQDVRAEGLPEVVGKELAQKIIDNAVTNKAQTFEGLDLKVGGEGMKGFYDKIIPDFINKYAKKWGVKAGWTTLPTPDSRANRGPKSEAKFPATEKVHSIDITPELKAAVLTEGQPLFQNGQTPQASIQFTDSATLINLFKTADYSSFLHESAHLFTKEMKRVIDLNLGDERFKKDYETLVDFAGGKLDTEGWEKIARGFEAYLREGKAPSIALADAFSKFKAWLMAIYKSVTQLNVEINDEVRGVFDRMLASEQEIADAEEYYRQKKSLLDLLPLDPKTKINLMEKQSMAHKVAVAKQTAKALKNYFTALGGRQVLRDQVKKEVEARPEYQAIKAIKAEGGIAIDTLTNQSDRDAFRKKKLTSANAKTSIEKIAADLDFESPEALVEAVTNAKPISEVVQDLTNQRVKEIEDTLKKDIERQELVKGEESLHNDASIEYLIAQAETLARAISDVEPKATSPKRIEAKAFKDAAIEAIGKKTLRRAPRYDLFSKAEQKYANEAYDLLKKGKTKEAYQAMQKQILNHALVTEAVKAREEIAKAEKSYKTKNLKSRMEKVENDYALFALHLIKTFGLNPAAEGKAVDITKLDQGLVMTSPEWVIKAQLPEGVQSYKDLSVEQFRDLHATIQSLIGFGREELTSLEDEQFKTVTDIVDASVKEMEGIKSKTVYDEFSIKGRFLNKIDGLVAKAKLAEFVFERLDNYSFTKNKTFGPLRKLYNRGVKAEVDFKNTQEKAYNAAKPHWEVLNKAMKRLEEKYRGKSFELAGVPMNEDMKRVGRNNWTVERLAAFVLNMGNEGNLKALAEGYQYGPEQMAVIVEQFTEEELNAIQGIWDATDVLYPELDRVHFKLYNRHLAKVEAKELMVSSSEGKVFTLKGGYYPLIFDHAINDIAEMHAEQKAINEADMLSNQMSAVFRKTKPEDGFTFARTGGALPPELSLNVWFSHITNTARYISHAEFMRDLNRVTLRSEWRAAVRDKAGREVYKYIRDWVSYLALPERPIRSPWDKMLEKQRSLATIAVLGANFTVGIKQRLAFLNVAEEIGWKWIASGAKDTDVKTGVFGMESGDAWQKLTELSPYLKARQGNIDRELRDATSKMSPFVKRFEVAGKEFTWKDVKDFMFEFIVMNDRAMIAVSWRGAFNRFMDENAKNPDMTDEQRLKDAVQKADSIISTTQPSSFSIDLSSFSRDEGMMRLFTGFMTGALKYGNRVQLKYAAWKDGAITSRQYFRHLLYETVFYGYSEALISSFMLGAGLPEWWELITSPFETLASWIPFVRDIAGSLKYQGKKIGDSTAFEGVNRIKNAGVSTTKALTNDGDWAKASWEIGKAVEFQLGVPALRVVKDINRHYDNITGQNKK